MLTQGQTRWSILPSNAMADLSPLRTLSRSFLAGEPTVEQIIVRGIRILGRSWPWLRPVAQRYVKTFSGRTRPRHRDVVQFLLDDPRFARAWSRHFHELSVAQWLIEPQRMQPVAAAENWGIPEIESPGALAEWFGISTIELLWFSDLKGLGYKKDRSPLRHHHFRVLAKQSGNIRLIEAPKSRLKELQRQVLSRILESVPPHASVHGFLKGIRSRLSPLPTLGVGLSYG